jgi:hypothetical protein
MYNLNYTPTTLGVQSWGKLHLRVREQKRLNTTGLDDCWWVGIRFWAGEGIFLFLAKFRPAVGSTQPSLQWVPVFFPGRKTAVAWSWPLTSTQCRVKNAWSYTSTPPYTLMAWRLIEPKASFPVRSLYNGAISEDYCLLLPWRLRQHVPSKRRQWYTRQHDDTSHKRVIFIVTSVRTSDLSCLFSHLSAVSEFRVSWAAFIFKTINPKRKIFSNFERVVVLHCFFLRLLS